MEITIKITSQDILFNPDILEATKELWSMLAEGKNQDEPLTYAHNYSVEDVRKALGDFSKTNGSQAAKKILNAFKASKVTELLEKDYSNVMDAVKAVK
ncbi:MAG TPA: hypothetical protein DIC60_03270 [Lachnospiraceae bacterium]|nr:hypothetical protein [Lachnospiraceae bacterium]